MDRNESLAAGRWVQERLAALDPLEGWEPDPAVGWTRLCEQVRTAPGKRRIWKWALATTVTTGLSLALLPSPRVLAHLCVECSMAVWQSLAAPGPVRSELKAEGERKKAPDFTLSDADGRVVKLSGLKGNVVLLNFWATWCHGCQIEIPWFVEFQKKHGTQGLSVVGVSVDEEGWKVVKPWIEEKRVNYRIVLGDEEIKKRFGVEALPVTLLIDRNGNLASVHDGLVNKQSCENDLNQLLKETGKNSR